MTRRRLRPLTLEGPAGRLEALLEESPARAPVVAALVCHPHPLHGGTLHNKVAHTLGSTLAELGGVSLRFNFRGAGRSEGRFDQGRGEREDARAALRHLRAHYPGARLWAAGFSFGAWVALRVGAEEPDVERLVGVAPPVGRSDFTFLAACPKPKLILQGDADDVCPLPELQAAFAGWAQPKALVVVSGANHFFDRHLTRLAQALRESLAEAAGAPG